MRGTRPLSQAQSTAIVLPAGESVDAPIAKTEEQRKIFYVIEFNIKWSAPAVAVTPVAPVAPVESAATQPESAKDEPVTGLERL